MATAPLQIVYDCSPVTRLQGERNIRGRAPELRPPLRQYRDAQTEAFTVKLRSLRHVALNKHYSSQRRHPKETHPLSSREGCPGPSGLIISSGQPLTSNQTKLCSWGTDTAIAISQVAKGHLQVRKLGFCSHEFVAVRFPYCGEVGCWVSV